MHTIYGALLVVGVNAVALWTVYTNIVTISSFMHSLLPPWDNPALDAFPRFQKCYRASIYFLGYSSASLRSSVHKSISTQNGTQISPVVQRVINGNGK